MAYHDLSVATEAGGQQEPKPLAVLVGRLGPYHAARLRAARQRGRVVAVELVRRDSTYSWDLVEPAGDFERVTLFNEQPRSGLIRLSWLALSGALSRLAPSAVAIPGWSSVAALNGLRWCVETSTPAVLMADSTRRDARRYPWSEWAKGRLLRAFSAALVSGKSTESYLEALGYTGRPVRHGYDVVDNEYFATGAARARGQAGAGRAVRRLPGRYFLASCRFIERKNVIRLLRAYAEYSARASGEPWELVVLGDGPLRPQLEILRASLGLEGRVHFPGFVQYADLPAFYGRASAFVHAATVEQWGLVVNEAMASGLPVLVSRRCGCAPDLVQEGVNGFTFDPFDIEEITARLLALSSGVWDLRAFGDASRRIIAAWTPEVFAERLWEAARLAAATPFPGMRRMDRLLLEALLRR